MFGDATEDLKDVGDPVDVVHGNMTTVPQVDFELSGINEPLRFYRTYHSQSEYDGPLGYGWTHNLNVTITRRGTYLWEIMDGEGKFHFFNKQSSFDPDYDNLSYDGSYLTDEAPLKNTWVAKDGTRFNFPYVYNAVLNTPYRVTSIEYPDGNAITFSPSDGSLPTTITDTHGRTITIAYSGGRISTIQEPGRPGGELIQYAYTGDNLTSVTYPVDASTDISRQYVYNDINDSHNLTEIIDERGNSFNFTYDTSDRCYQAYGESVGGGNYLETALVYDPANNRTTVTRVRGAEQFNDIYTYTDMGYIVQIDHQESGITEKYTQNFVFHDIDNEYTPPGIPVGTSSVEKLVTDGTDHYKTIWHLDGNFNVIDVVEGRVPTVNDDPTGTPVEMTYDGTVNVNYLVNINDQRGVNVELQYGDGSTNPGDRGKLTLERKHNDSVPGVYYETSTYDYNLDGTLDTITDPNGKVTGFGYDASGILTSIDPPGVLPAVQYSRDGAGRITQIVQKDDSGSDRYIDIDRDWLGRKTQVTYPIEGGSRLMLTYDYDATDLYDAGASYGFNVVDTGGIKTQYLYNAAGMLWKIVRDRHGAAPAVTVFGYDAYGNLVSRTDPEGNVATFAYDSLDRLASVTDHESNSKSFTYYPDGSLKSRTDQESQNTQYAYDSDNQLYQITYPDLSTMTFTYEDNGLVATITDASGTVSFEYDDVNRLSAADGALAGTVDRVSYQYYDGGQKHYMTSTLLGQTSYDLNDSNALWRITNPNNLVTEYAYNQYTGAPSRVTNHGNGTYTDYDYDNLGRLDLLENHTSGGLMSSYDLQHYDSSLIQKITLDSGNHYDYVYDDLYRLSSETLKPSKGKAIYSYAYQHDQAENRTRFEYDMWDVYAANTLNQITGIATVRRGKTPKPGDWHTALAYDLNGNLTLVDADGDITTYDFDYENRLTEITYHDSTSTEFVYDPLGRRLKAIEKDSGGATVSETRYVYDGRDLIAELDGQSATIASYTHGQGIDAPVSMRYNGSDYFYHSNHQGSITAITDSSEATVKTYEYDAFGNIRSQTGTLAHNAFTYAGREYHSKSGLYYYRNRFYNPQLGRFINQDPIGYVGGTNLYAYVGNDPVNFTDPLGLLSEEQCETIRKILEYEKKWGTFLAARKFSNTPMPWDINSTPMGRNFDNKPIETVVGVIDFDWWTDMQGSFTTFIEPDIQYFYAKIVWSTIRDRNEYPNFTWPYQDYKEGNTVFVLEAGYTSYSDLFPEEFLKQACPCENDGGATGGW
jgi:RHS repeat-associated protein